MVKCLVQFVKNKNLKNAVEKRTPVTLAAEYGHLEVVRFLAQYVKHKIELNGKDCYPKSALDLAKENEHNEVIQYLESL